MSTEMPGSLVSRVVPPEGVCLPSEHPEGLRGSETHNQILVQKSPNQQVHIEEVAYIAKIASVGA